MLFLSEMDLDIDNPRENKYYRISGDGFKGYVKIDDMDYADYYGWTVPVPDTISFYDNNKFKLFSASLEYDEDLNPTSLRYYNTDDVLVASADLSWGYHYYHDDEYAALCLDGITINVHNPVSGNDSSFSLVANYNDTYNGPVLQYISILDSGSTEIARLGKSGKVISGSLELLDNYQLDLYSGDFNKHKYAKKNTSLNSYQDELTLKGSGNYRGTGNDNPNTITGNSGNNTLNGGDGDDTLIGNSGNDYLNGGAGTDSLVGGKDNDTYFIDSLEDIIVEISGQGTDRIMSGISYTLGDYIENLTLSGSDNIDGTGNSLNNVITGNDFDNILDGAEGKDTLIGGTGNDTYIVDNIKDKIYENSKIISEIDEVQSSVSFILGDNLENLLLTGTASINGTGNKLNNTITGNEGNNILDGKTGADSLIGGAGNDTYYIDNIGDQIVEDAGNDTVMSSISYTLGADLENLTLTGSKNIDAEGNSSDNAITANSKNNVINGAGGSDILIGGNGNDTYIFALGDGQDSIRDSGGKGDKISFDSSINTGKFALFMDSSKNLVIDYGDTVDTDQIIIQNQKKNTIEKIQLSDGKYLSNADINSIISYINSYATQHSMTISGINDVKANSDLIAYLSTQWHS